MYSDERGPHSEMEHYGSPGPGREHFGLPGPEMERLGPPPPLHGEGATGLPSLLDIRVPRPQQASAKRGAEHIDGNFHDDELPSHQFSGPPPEKMPSNYGPPGNDMWPSESPTPPLRGPGRGGRPPFRGVRGRGAPRGRGMRRGRGR